MILKQLKKYQARLCAIALIASMLSILAFPLYHLYVDSDSPDSSASITALIEFSEICRPNGDDLAQWTKSSGTYNYEMVDETTAGSDTTTTYNTGETGEKDIYTMTDMSSEDRGEYTEIDGVTLWVWAIRGGTGVNSLTMGVRISDTDYVGSTFPTTASWVNYTYTYTVNPATTAAWTITQVNALECYLNSVDGAPTHQVSQLAVLVPGRQTVWPPTFTSTPDTSAIVGNAYSYTATANETSTFSLFDSTPSTGPYSIVLRPSADVSSTNFLDVPDTDVYYDKLDETDANSDTETTRFYTGVTSSQATWYGELTNLPDYDYYDIDIGGWVWMQASGSETDAGGGIQTTPGETGTNNDIYRGAISTSWLNKSIQWEVNPETSVEWTESGVNSLRAYCLDGSYTLATAFSQFGLLVNYTLISAVADWVTFTPANATLWGTPDIGDVGFWHISLQADSAAGEGSAWQNWTIRVTEPWTPTFTSSAIENAAVGIEYNYSYLTNETCTFDVTLSGETGDDTVYAQAQFGWYSSASYHYWYLTETNGGRGWLRWDLESVIGSGATIESVTIHQQNDGTGPTGYARLHEAGSLFTGAGGESEHSTGYTSPCTIGDYIDHWLVGGAGWHTYQSETFDAYAQETYDDNGYVYLMEDAYATSEMTGSTIYNYNGGTTWAQAHIAYIDVEYSLGDISWLSWDSVDDFIWGTPDAGSTEVDVSIEATNDVGGVSWQNWTITIGPPWAPTFSSTPDTTATADDLYSYIVTCNETVTWPIDDDFLTDATFLNWGQTNHTLYGTPTVGDVGSYYVNVSATSVAGYLVAYHNYTLVVAEVDDDPVAHAGPDQSVLVNVTVTFSGALSTDDDAIANYTWSFVYNGSTEYLYGVSPTFVFEFPNVTYTVTLTVTDTGAQTDDDTMTVTTTPPADLPLTPLEWVTTSGVMTIMGIIGFIGMVSFPVLYVKFRDRSRGAMNGFVAFIFIEMVLFGLFFASLLSG